MTSDGHLKASSEFMKALTEKLGPPVMIEEAMKDHLEQLQRMAEQSHHDRRLPIIKEMTPRHNYTETD